jgi:RimJ/RimL family protein N-acetyltransferase
MWTYLPFGPFADEAELTAAIAEIDSERDLRFYAVIDPGDDVALGLMAYLRIEPEAGSIEVGAVMFSPRLQRTRLATEALFLMADHVFALGYRRFEWKCDSLNAPSRRAAERFGFTFEGVFRQATVYKQRSRDTAWFAMLDHEWPDRRERYRSWLAEDNFDPAGQQLEPLVAWPAAGLAIELDLPVRGWRGPRRPRSRRRRPGRPAPRRADPRRPRHRSGPSTAPRRGRQPQEGGDGPDDGHRSITRELSTKPSM